MMQLHHFNALVGTICSIGAIAAIVTCDDATVQIFAVLTAMGGGANLGWALNEVLTQEPQDAGIR